ncbi:hypothetical protein GCM10027020_10250 [Nocardioides salsibiostraticola]
MYRVCWHLPSSSLGRHTLRAEMPHTADALRTGGLSERTVIDIIRSFDLVLGA